MTLIDDFKTKYPRYWSVWLNAIAGVLTALQIIEVLGYMLPALEGLLPPGAYACASLFFIIAGLIARGIKQFGLADPEKQP